MSETQLYVGENTVSATARANAGKVLLERHPDPLVRVQELAYVLFERPDLEQQRAFLQDFGMQLAGSDDTTLYFRGHGPSPWFYAASRGDKPRFLGAGFGVATEAELARVAAHHGAAEEAVDGPGGGRRVRVEDPNGYIVDYVWGRAAAERIPCRDTLFTANSPTRKLRVNSGVRACVQPSPLEKVGHLVLSVPDFAGASAWYLQNLGLIPSDVQCVEDGTPVLAFMRLDRGDTPADHHTVVLAQNLARGLLHVAFETLDLDAVGQGQQHLKSKGWQHQWGIGRHILGSQIFDYWKDPCGTELEHYADGDVFTADAPTGYHPLDPGNLYCWGDDAPPPPAPGPLKMLLFVLTGGLKNMPPALLKMRGILSRPARPWLD